MNEIMIKALDSLVFGDPIYYLNLTILPIFGDLESDFKYISLSNAMKQKIVTIKEMSEDGSVNELIVDNKGDLPILIIDGEEIVGAKQNRIANSTMLIKENCQTKIPVSCSEAGRWDYTSREFRESEIVTERKVRTKKLQTVTASLKQGDGHRSDQSEVWNEISQFQERHKAHSPTNAMHFVFESRKRDLAGLLKKFALQDKQTGLIIYDKGQAIGLDVISRSDVYRDLHDKFIRSYAIDALQDDTVGEQQNESVNPKDFTNLIKAMQTSQFDSIGYGIDYRFSEQDYCGTALVHSETCIHLAALKSEIDNESSTGRGLAGSRERRRRRRDWDSFFDY